MNRTLLGFGLGFFGLLLASLALALIGFLVFGFLIGFGLFGFGFWSWDCWVLVCCLLFDGFGSSLKFVWAPLHTCLDIPLRAYYSFKAVCNSFKGMCKLWNPFDHYCCHCLFLQNPNQTQVVIKVSPDGGLDCNPCQKNKIDCNRETFHCAFICCFDL